MAFIVRLLDSNKIVVQNSVTGELLRNITAPGLTPTSFLVGSYDGRNLATWSKEGSQVTIWHLSWVVNISLAQSGATTNFQLSAFGLDPNSWLQLTIYAFPIQCVCCDQSEVGTKCNKISVFTPISRYDEIIFVWN